MRVAIIGTGSYGKSLGIRLQSSGITVVYGSRRGSDGNPFEVPNNTSSSEREPLMVNGFPVLKPCAAALLADIIVLAVPISAYSDIAQCLGKQLSERKSEQRVIIDISNPPLDKKERKHNVKLLSEKAGLQCGKDIESCAIDFPEIEECGTSCSGGCMNGKSKTPINPPEPGASNAELLQCLFPHTPVVKAFNTLSAYSLQQKPGDLLEDRVLICGDDAQAKKRVSTLVSLMGLRPVDYGPLSAAREVEKRPMRFFDAWAYGFKVSFVAFILALLYVAMRDLVLAGNKRWEDIFLLKFNIALAWHSMFLMTITFLAGMFAAVRQLATGTAKKAFPQWLDSWLRARKALGVLGLASGLLH
eukprot:Colp12_sorted_trinity150504_noHs@15096